MNKHFDTIRVTACHGATDEDARRAREVVTRALAHTAEPVLYAHVTLAELSDPVVPCPALVSIRADLNGRPVTAHAAARTLSEAIAQASDRLRLRIESNARGGGDVRHHR